MPRVPSVRGDQDVEGVEQSDLREEQAELDDDGESW